MSEIRKFVRAEPKYALCWIWITGIGALSLLASIPLLIASKHENWVYWYMGLAIVNGLNCYVNVLKHRDWKKSQNS